MKGRFVRRLAIVSLVLHFACVALAMLGPSFDVGGRTTRREFMFQSQRDCFSLQLICDSVPQGPFFSRRWNLPLGFSLQWYGGGVGVAPRELTYVLEVPYLFLALATLILPASYFRII